MPSNVRRLVMWLLAVIAGLLVIHTFCALTGELVPGKIRDRFNLDAEATIPAWLSGVLLASVAISSFIVHLVREPIRDTAMVRLFWFVFAAGFAFLSVDEGAQLHEMIDEETPVKWIFVYAPFGAAFFAYVVWYLVGVRRSVDAVARLVIGGMLLFGLGGLVAEGIDHFFYPLPPTLQLIEIVAEEGLEMVGTTLILAGCLTDVGRR